MTRFPEIPPIYSLRHIIRLKAIELPTPVSRHLGFRLNLKLGYVFGLKVFNQKKNLNLVAKSEQSSENVRHNLTQ
jgi:hypothetical protein